MALVFSHVDQLVKIFKSIFILLKLKIEKTSLHQPLAHGLLVHCYHLGVRHHRVFDKPQSFQAVSLSKVPHSIAWRMLKNSFKIRERLVPLLLEDINLPSCDVGFKVVWIFLNGLGKSSDGTDIVVDSSVSDRQDNKHGLSIVRTNLHQLFQVGDRFVWHFLVKVCHRSVEKRIIVLFIGLQALREHFAGIFVFFLGQEYFSRFKELFAVEDLLLRHLVLRLD